MHKHTYIVYEYIKILSCWGANSFDYGILPIYAILIGLIGYFCFKAYCFIGNYKQKMMEDNEKVTKKKSKKKKESTEDLNESELFDIIDSMYESDGEE